MEIVVLEDNKEYYILDTINVLNKKYVYLCEVEDKTKKNVCVRKLVDNDTNIAGLDSEEELTEALNAYKNKYEHVVMAA
jgi:hypothetical protein